MSQTIARGQQAEQLALAHLRTHQLQLLETNYHCRHGEIDLIMRDQQQLVFVEVRYRQSDAFGGSLESVDSRKQAKIQATAEHYLQSKPRLKFDACRFDVVAMAGDIQAPSIDWIEAAF